jgi:chitinase
MAYDFHGAWETKTGSNAAMVSSEGDYSVSNVVETYLKGGVPAAKIVLGLPVYGRVFTLQGGVKLDKRDLVGKLKKRACAPPGSPANNTADATATPKELSASSNSADAADKKDTSTTSSKSGASSGKVPGYGVAANAGKLSKCVGAPDVLPYFELVALFNDPQSKSKLTIDDSSPEKGLIAVINDQWITFDDEKTIAVKAKLIKEKGLGGAMMWAIDQDTEDFAYAKAVRKYMRG